MMQNVFFPFIKWKHKIESLEWIAFELRIFNALSNFVVSVIFWALLLMIQNWLSKFYSYVQFSHMKIFERSTHIEKSTLIQRFIRINTIHSLHDAKITRQMAHIFNVIKVTAINEVMRCIVCNRKKIHLENHTYAANIRNENESKLSVRKECHVSGYSIDGAKQQLSHIYHILCVIHCHIATQTIIRIAFCFRTKINNFIIVTTAFYAFSSVHIS